MRKKHLLTKTLAIVLSATICAGGTGIQALASTVQLSQEAEGNMEEYGVDTVKTVSANEGLPEETDTTATEGTESTAESKEKADEPEEVETDAEAEDTIWTDTDLDADKIVVNDSTKVSSLIPDGELRKELLAIYNEQEMDELAETDFTYQYLKKITKIDLSENNDAANIKSIEGLGYASGATYVDISTTGITGIAASAFFNAADVGTSLETIVLPDRLQKIGRAAFSGCDKLQNIWVRDTEGNIKDDSNRLPEGLVAEGVEPGAFKGCTALKQIELNCQSGNTLIKATEMFAGCSGLAQVTIGKNITILPVSIFQQAGDKDKGMSVEFEEGSQLNVIEANAFQCANVETIDLTNCEKLENIGARAFMRWNSVEANMGDAKNASSKYVKTLILPSETKGLTLGDELFFNTPVEAIYPAGTEETVEAGTVILPDYVTHLGRAAFYYAGANISQIKNVTLSANMDGIEGYTFYYCTNLEKVTVSKDTNGDSKIEKIKNAAFAHTNKLQNGSFIGDMNHLIEIGESESDPKKTYKYDTTNFKNLSYKDYVLQTEKQALESNVSSQVFTESGL